MNSANVTSQTVENALTGEKSFRSVNFPATGDWETELVLVVQAYVGMLTNIGFPTDPTGFIHPRTQGRIATVLEYLAKRYRDDAARQGDEEAKAAKAAQQQFAQQNVNYLGGINQYSATSVGSGPGSLGYPVHEPAPQPVKLGPKTTW